jgi:hypothetical protein
MTGNGGLDWKSTSFEVVLELKILVESFVGKLLAGFSRVVRSLGLFGFQTSL